MATPLILLLYVDDLFITKGEHLIEACKKDLASKFEMPDLGSMHYYLGMEVQQENGHVFPGERKICCRYSEEIPDGGVQAHVHTHDHQLEEASCF